MFSTSVGVSGCPYVGLSNSSFVANLVVGVGGFVGVCGTTLSICWSTNRTSSSKFIGSTWVRWQMSLVAPDAQGSFRPLTAEQMQAEAIRDGVV